MLIRQNLHTRCGSILADFLVCCRHHGGIDEIRPYVDEFIEFARKHPELTFLVTRIGCGIAGFTDQQIAPLFVYALEMSNVILPKTFVEILKK